MTIDDLTLDTTQSIDIKADIGDVFRSNAATGSGKGSASRALHRKANRCRWCWSKWAGGRWFRCDRGNGGVGHLWGHVQVIKPPVLLELSGPMFMSYPAVNHLEVKAGKVGPEERMWTFVTAPWASLTRRTARVREHRLEVPPGRSRPGLFRARRRATEIRCPGDEL